MGKKVIGLKNSMKTTYFSKVTTAYLWKSFITGKMDWAHALKCATLIGSLDKKLQTMDAGQDVTQVFLNKVDSLLENHNDWFATIQELLRGQNKEIEKVFDFLQKVDVTTMTKYDTKLLTHVQSMGKIPATQSIKFKFSLYNTVICYTGNPANVDDEKKRLLFLSMVMDFNFYMNKLQSQIIDHTWEYNINPAERVIVDQINDFDGKVMWPETKPVQSVNDQADHLLTELRQDGTKPMIVSKGKNTINAGRSRNPTQLLILYQRREDNFRKFRKEVTSMFGDQVAIFTDQLKLKFYRESKKYMFILPLIEPKQDKPIWDVGYKYLQTIVTYDKAGVEAEMAAYGKRVLQNQTVVLRSDPAGRYYRRKRLKIRPNKYSILPRRRPAKKVYAKKKSFGNSRLSSAKSKWSINPFKSKSWNKKYNRQGFKNYSSRNK